MITRRQLLFMGAISIPAGSLIGTAAAEETSPFVCTTPQFTEHDQFSAGEVQLKPTSGSGGTVELNTGPSSGNALTLQKFQLLLRSDAWRADDSLSGGSGKIRVAVHFLDGTDFQKAAVEKYASDWLVPSGADKVEFVFGSPERRHIRVLFNTQLNQGAHGREALLYTNLQEPTMWLGDVRPEVASDRIAAVIRHEFGHALGMRHEHQHPLGGIKWNRDKIVAYYTKFPGWTAEKVQEQVFDIYSDSSYMCIGAPQFDTKSIMMYPIPEGWAQNMVVPYNINIDPSDFQCIRVVYA
jgi:hypothetical protein